MQTWWPKSFYSDRIQMPQYYIVYFYAGNRTKKTQINH